MNCAVVGDSTSAPSPSPTIYRDWKVVQRPGAFAYPVHHAGRVVNRLALFTPQKIRRYHQTVTAMLADGISIPIIPEHDAAGVPLTRREMEKHILANSVGFIRGSRLTKAGELELLHEVSDPTWAAKMGTTVLDCSPGFRDWYRTGDGKKWTDVVAHVALTHHPVDHHKPKFAPGGCGDHCECAGKCGGGKGGSVPPLAVTVGGAGTTYMSLTPAIGPDSTQLVPIWEVPFSTILTCLAQAGTSYIFKHADGKERFGSRSKAVNWLRAQYSRQFSLAGGTQGGRNDSGVIWMAIIHAPKGGVHVQGRFYLGGQFIPNEVMQRATPEEKQRIKAARADYDKKTLTTARTYMNDAETVHDAILRYAGDHGKAEQSPDDKRDTLWRWEGLKNKYGSEKAAIEQVVGMAANEAKKLAAPGPEDDPSQIKRRLAAYAAMVRFGTDAEHEEDHRQGASERVEAATIAPAAGGPPKPGKATIKPSQGEVPGTFDRSMQNVEQLKPAETAKTSEETPKDIERSNTNVEQSSTTIQPLVESGLASSDITSRMKAKYGQTVSDLHKQLPPKAHEHLAANVKGFVFHEDTAALTEKLIERSPDMKAKLGRAKAGGAYSKKTGELHLNGGTTLDGKKLTQDHVYAHEFAHAIDGPEHALSKDKAWHEAWKAEAPLVSKYATKTPQEGFAEFGRLVYASGLNKDQLSERYPKMMEHWGKLELLPDGMGTGAGGTQLAEGKEPQMADVFEGPINTPDTIGDKALAKRATGEGLEDYLRSIGGHGAHDTIRDMAKSLHEQDKYHVDEHNEIVRHAMSSLTSHYGKGFNKNHPDLKKDDPSEVKGLDVAASELAGQYPHIFGADASYEGGGGTDTVASAKAMEKLHDMLKEGIKEYPELRDYEDQAVQEWHDNGRPLPEGAEGVGASGTDDTSFDFGANAPSGSGNDAEGGTQPTGEKRKGRKAKAASEPPVAGTDDSEPAPNPFAPTPEESKAAWEKFASHAKAKGGLTLPSSEQKTAAKDIQKSDGAGSDGEERDTGAMLRAKMEREGKGAGAGGTQSPAPASAPAPAKVTKYDTETGEPNFIEKPHALTPGKKSYFAKDKDGDIVRRAFDTPEEAAQETARQRAMPVATKSPQTPTPPAPTPTQIAAGDIPKKSASATTIPTSASTNPNLGYHEEGGKFYAKDRYGEKVGGEGNVFDTPEEAEARTDELAARKNEPTPTQVATGDSSHANTARTARAPTPSTASHDLPTSPPTQGGSNRRASSDPDGSTRGFMEQAPFGPHTEDDIEEYAGQAFTNDKGFTGTVTKDEDGTWSVGSKYGLSAGGVTSYLNKIGAVKARGLFGDEVTAQKMAENSEKKSEPLKWPEPMKVNQNDSASAALPGMADTFAPGMFGKAKTEGEAAQAEADGQGGTPTPADIATGKTDKPSSKWKNNGDGTYTSPNGTVWRKAKAGGEESPVNGKRFAGGALMPIHGLHEKSEKKPEPEGDGISGGESKPNPNKQPSSRQPIKPMTAEEIEQEKQRREEQKKWDEVKSGPLNQFLRLGDRPHNIKYKTGGARPFGEFGKKMGAEKMAKFTDYLREKVKQQSSDEIDADPGLLGSRMGVEPITKEEALKRQEEHLNWQEGNAKSSYPKNHVPGTPMADVLMQEYLNGKDDHAKLHDLHTFVQGLGTEQSAKPSKPSSPGAGWMGGRTEVPMSDERQAKLTLAEEAHKKLMKGDGDGYRATLRQVFDGDQAKIDRFTSLKRGGSYTPQALIKAMGWDVEEENKGKPAANDKKPAQPLEGWHDEQSKSLASAMTRQLDAVTSPRRKIDVAMRLVHGEPPAVQAALLDHLKETAPEAYQYGKDNPESVGLSVRKMFQEHGEEGGTQAAEQPAKPQQPEQPKPEQPKPKLPEKAQALTNIISDTQTHGETSSDRISDFGEKIGGARKDTAVPLGPRKPKEDKPADDDTPGWKRRYQVVENKAKVGAMPSLHQRSSQQGGFLIADKRSNRILRNRYETAEEAEKAIPLVAVAQNHNIYRTAGKNGESDTYGIHRKLGERKRPLVRGGFASEADAMKYMAAHPEEIIEHKFNFPSEVPHLEHIQREGREVRKGNISPKDFQKAFDFRGGEFGNWNHGEHGQQALNHAYDAMHDFSDVLGVDPKAISLNGELAIAFGARGTGGKDAGRAHYEEDKKVINLTKIKGAGTLAHEWFHALDHYVSRMNKREGFASHGLGYKPALREELASAYKNVIDTMTATSKTVPITANNAQSNKDHADEWLKNSLGELESRIRNNASYNKRHKPFTPEQQKQWDGLKEKILAGDVGERITVQGKSAFKSRHSYQPIEDMNVLFKKATGYSFANMEDHSEARKLFNYVNGRKDAEKRVAAAQAGETATYRSRTNYLDEARKIDSYRSSDYWSEPHEMAARAFEAFVKDKLADKRSDYLVYGTRNHAGNSELGKPYPEGEERTAINAAFENLFKVIKREELYNKDGGKKDMSLLTYFRHQQSVSRVAHDVHPSPLAIALGM